MMKFIGQLYTLYTYSLFVLALDQEYTLKSVSVAFRHGDRTPEAYPKEMYPNDPHRNKTFEPMGFGGLTNEGKKREYQIGLKLRERYNKFLGDVYKSSDVSVISTPSVRTRMSLLLVLAGLFPPKGKQIWEKSFDWQPIPISSVPLGFPSYLYVDICPTYINELERVQSTDEYKKDMHRFGNLFKNLTALTGHPVDSVKAVYKLYLTLVAEQGMNLDLPAWTKSYFPDGLITNATLFEYQTRSYTPKLIRLNGGMFLRKILNDILYEKKEASTKIFLYSVHDINIAGLLFGLKLWENNIPTYGSGVITELYEKEFKLFIRIVYYNGIPPEFEVQQIPGCTEFCPLEIFVDILKYVIPDDTMEVCFGPPDHSLFVPKDINSTAWMYSKMKKWFNL